MYSYVTLLLSLHRCLPHPNVNAQAAPCTNCSACKLSCHLKTGSAAHSELYLGYMGVSTGMGKRAHARISDTSVRVYGGRAASLGFRASVFVRAAAGEEYRKRGHSGGYAWGLSNLQEPIRRKHGGAVSRREMSRGAGARPVRTAVSRDLVQR